MSIILEMLSFLWSRGKFFLIPLVLAMILVGGIAVFSGGSAFSPFIYALF